MTDNQCLMIYISTHADDIDSKHGWYVEAWIRGHAVYLDKGGNQPYGHAYEKGNKAKKPKGTKPKANGAEYTGGSSSYYRKYIEKPTTKGTQPYIAECNDIIEALNMNFTEGNIFKAIWRMCAARMGKTKKGYTDGRYDAEKVLFFAERLLLSYK